MKSKDKRNETLELHTGPIQSYAEDTSANHTPSQDEIRLRAYEIHLERGDLPGNEFDDWLQAERELERPAPKAERFSIKRASERSEEHTSELQSRLHLVCRLLLEK